MKGREYLSKNSLDQELTPTKKIGVKKEQQSPESEVQISPRRRGLSAPTQNQLTNLTKKAVVHSK